MNEHIKKPMPHPSQIQRAPEFTQYRKDANAVPFHGKERIQCTVNVCAFQKLLKPESHWEKTEIGIPYENILTEHDVDLAENAILFEGWPLTEKQFCERFNMLRDATAMKLRALGFIK